MATDWDLFMDEVKDGGDLRAIGVLAFHAGVTEGIFHSLWQAKAKVIGAGVEVGEIHWSRLTAIEAGIAKHWLSYFLKGPVMFFLMACCKPGETKAGAVRRVIGSLEQDERVPRGLHRSKTVLHVDLDTSDEPYLLRGLRRNFGLLRAFAWDSKGSLLLQLSDLLLGIAEADASHSLDQLPADASKQKQLRLDVLTHARKEARSVANRGKRNAVLAMRPDGQTRWLLVDDGNKLQ